MWPLNGHCERREWQDGSSVEIKSNNPSATKNHISEGRAFSY
jgi:hypothetical protein